MAKRDQDVHFLASKEEVERIHEKMDELGIRSMEPICGKWLWMVTVSDWICRM